MEEKMSNVENDLSISWKDIFDILINRKWIVLVSGLLCAVLLCGYTYLTSDVTYTADAMLYVNNTSLSGTISELTSSAFSTSRNLVPTYESIAKARMTLELLADSAWENDGYVLTYTYEQLSKMIATSQIEDTPILVISVTSRNAEESRIISDAIVRVMRERIPEVISGTSATVVDAAVTPTRANSRGLVQKAVIGFCLGFLLSFAVCFVFDFLINDTVQSADWLREAFGDGIPILAVIPEAGFETKQYGYYRHVHREDADSPHTGDKV